MNKVFALFIIFFSLLLSCAFAQNYDEIYSSQNTPDFKLMKGIDPFQQEDYYDCAWAPYPLFRNSFKLYYKSGSIEPGYYLLVPRKMNGRDYVFFKENGKVKHVIPVYKADIVPEYFYENNFPQLQLTKSQKRQERISKVLSKVFKNTQQKEPKPALIQTSNIDNNYFEIVLYYGNNKYYMLLSFKEKK